MTRWFAVILTALVLLQTFSQELRVVDYQLHTERITKLFCVNKARPQLHCNGKCHLAKQLRKAADAESKAPNDTEGKLEFEALPLLRFRVARLVSYPTAPRRFIAFRAAQYAFSPVHGIFHPPSFWV
ncbi:hypothetical protein MUN82_12640 [Hymenobacter aerilatus]|uniref:Uncharacterized protein n=1 Tax=Hymenobacter aerilatus TaxID=2932251 RepID=A0A8T9SRZ1_9BACT|nr:hypothetical protein [Hymenobacter aerilatus]UOR03794.1 hypothetical protein MUN82_12640 [Hymenobacter aerilatus]